jgi:hypothetical protein
MNTGIITSDTSLDKEVLYDSRKKKMTVDLDPVLKRADVITLDGGTRLVTTTPNQTISETLWTYTHKMPFRPQVHAFFYVTDAPDAAAITNGLVVGSYYKTYLPIVYNATGYGDEGIELVVDDKTISLVHTATSGSSISGTSPFNGVGNLLKFRFRYIVVNQRAIDVGSSS